MCHLWIADGVVSMRRQLSISYQLVLISPLRITYIATISLLRWCIGIFLRYFPCHCRHPLGSLIVLHQLVIMQLLRSSGTIAWFLRVITLIIVLTLCCLTIRKGTFYLLKYRAQQMSMYHQRRKRKFTNTSRWQEIFTLYTIWKLTLFPLWLVILECYQFIFESI